MPDSSIAGLVARIEQAFGIDVERFAPPGDLDAVPEPLQPLYAFSNGLTLPFANIREAGALVHDIDPEWVTFGEDNYFSFFLCRTSGELALTSWDHESQTPIEGAYGSAAEWLAAEFESFVDADADDNTVHIIAVPDGVSRTAIVAELKTISTRPSSEWLSLLNAPPFRVPGVGRRSAFEAVRALQVLGVECYVRCDG